MILDAKNQLASEQAMGTAGESTNYIDLESDFELGVGEQVYIYVLITETITGGGTDGVTFSLQTDDNTSFTSAATVQTFPELNEDVITAGMTFKWAIHPDTLVAMERYIRVYRAEDAGVDGGAASIWLVTD
jgi:hypothetical protein